MTQPLIRTEDSAGPANLVGELVLHRVAVSSVHNAFGLHHLRVDMSDRGWVSQQHWYLKDPLLNGSVQRNLQSLVRCRTSGGEIVLEALLGYITDIPGFYFSVLEALLSLN